MTRVLCVRLSAMGDVVQSLGAIRALHEVQPEWELGFVTQREHAPLLAGMPGIAAVIQHDRRGGLAAWRRTRAAMRAWRCDVALDLQGNWKSAGCARLSGAQRRIGAAAPGRQEPMSRVLLTQVVPVPDPPHPARVALAVVRALAPSARALAPRLAATEAEEGAAAYAVRATGIDPERPFAVALLGRPEDPRSLSPVALRAELDRGLPLLALAGPGERDVLTPDGARRWQQDRGELRTLVGLGRLLARVGGTVLGGDQGPAHVLAAAGADTSVWFGPQDPQRTAPPRARVLIHPAPPPCMPCRKRACAHRAGPVCMAFGRPDARQRPAVDWLEAGEA